MLFNMFLSIVIPTYNEERCILESLNRLSRYFDEKGFDYEIIISDDGSTDRTVEIAEKFQPGNPKIKILKNKHAGKGEAVKTGILGAKGEYILFTDADLSTPIGHFDQMLKSLQNGYDIAIASRGLKESRIEIPQPFFREKMGRLFNLLLRLILGTKIRDTQCGFKIFTRKAARHLFGLQSIRGWLFDAEILYLAKKHGYAVAEVPVKWRNAPNTKVNLFREILPSLAGLFKIRLNDLLGKYNHARKAI